MSLETPNPLLGREEKISPGKLAAAQYVVVGVLGVLTLGLWNLQVLGADTYRVQAEQNRVRKVPVLAPRGRILDREGRLIVDNYPSTTCYLLRDQIKDAGVDLPLIAQGLHLPLEQLQTTLRHFGSAPRYQRIPLKQDITPDEQAFVEAHRNELPELETLEEQRRLYPRDGFAAHIVGYVGEVSEQMLENDPRYAAYEPGDVVGKSGVEETYDALLRGTNGSRDVVVNSHGKEVGMLGQEFAVPGKDLRLTIDLDLQRAAEQALEGKNGAVVAIDPHTGEVLAMASRPTFDPNQFAVKLSQAYWKTILDNPEHPLLNKAIQAQLAPGSTFKIIMSVAGLAGGRGSGPEGELPGRGIVLRAFLRVRPAPRRGEHHECDPVLVRHVLLHAGVQAGDRPDCEVWAGAGDRAEDGCGPAGRGGGDYAVRAVEDEELPREVVCGRDDLGGDRAGRGDGDADAAGAGAERDRVSGGVLRRPHVVLPGQVPEEMASAVRDTFPGSGDKTIPLSAENWQTITDGMYAVTSSPIGTAYAAHLEGIDFAGKTGTADVVSGRQKNSKNKSTLPNAWFVGMTPRRNPDIAVAVLWQHGYWGNNSAKLASQVIDAFVEKQRKRSGNLRVAEAKKPVDSQSPTTEKPLDGGQLPDAGKK